MSIFIPTNNIYNPIKRINMIKYKKYYDFLLYFSIKLLLLCKMLPNLGKPIMSKPKMSKPKLGKSFCTILFSNTKVM